MDSSRAVITTLLCKEDGKKSVQNKYKSYQQCTIKEKYPYNKCLTRRNFQVANVIECRHIHLFLPYKRNCENSKCCAFSHPYGG